MMSNSHTTEARTKAARKERMGAILDALFDEAVEAGEILGPLVERFLTNYMRLRAATHTRMSGNTSYFDIRERERMEERERKRFRSTISYMKSQGLVERKHRGNILLWQLTKEGRSRLQELKARSMPYEKAPTRGVVVVSYDIPERLAHERRWVRGVLHFLDFEMLHKSVWIGKHRIPEEFLEDAKRRGVFECLHIFELGAKGTLEKII